MSKSVSFQQLANTLPFAVPPPVLPSYLKFEMATRHAAAFDALNWDFTVDWQGIRALAMVSSDGAVRLQADGQQMLTSCFSELQNVDSIFDSRNIILDGVITVLDGQLRPNLKAVEQRTQGQNDDVNTGTKALFLISDLLYLDGKFTLSWSYTKRLATLRKLVCLNSRWQLPEPIRSQGVSFANAMRTRGFSAILARRRHAPYRPGTISPDRLRISLEPKVEVLLNDNSFQTVKLPMPINSPDNNITRQFAPTVISSLPIDDWN